MSFGKKIVFFKGHRSLLEPSSTVLLNGNACTQFYRQIRPDAYPPHTKKVKFLSSTTFYRTNFDEKSSNTWPEIHSGFWFWIFLLLKESE